MHDVGLKKVIWAMDAFANEPSSDRQMKQVIQAITGPGRSDSKENEAFIQPTYLLIPDEVNILASTLDILWTRDYIQGAKKAIRQRLKNLNIAGVQEPRVLVHYGDSKRKAIEFFVEHCREENADLIVLGTHSRKGVRRFFMGSFAESLLLECPIPMVVVNPGARRIRKVKNVLFPVEFSDVCWSGLERLIPFLKERNASLTLFHRIPTPLEPVIGSGSFLLGGSHVPARAYFDKDRQAKIDEGRKWVRYAQDAGVQSELFVQYQGKGIADSILEMAEKKQSSLIAMVSQRGRVASAMLGSVTRQVVRAAPCPAWVLHPESESLKKKAA